MRKGRFSSVQVPNGVERDGVDLCAFGAACVVKNRFFGISRIPPPWPNGQGVCLRSRRFTVRIRAGVAVEGMLHTAAEGETATKGDNEGARVSGRVTFGRGSLYIRFFADS